ncbi:hypothetical protein BEP19_02375 [Ammoniphilus oxalaticus]|uniref:ABC transporter domain-containing protein n=1 Tax=Ammoniphilus oxalaticus TaxID=66863 RepID=A0A419SNC8_9BACL|nr:ATP-binding cassette domain-containing protein [Ammoniphilus oxalaticus]RKD25804.1 hypothetical protein BEP19_02375 [Ammoniphilus oxalaticus]
MINICNVSFQYENNGPSILENISLSIDEGEFVVFLGRNGSGKSTLSRLLNALHIPSKGKILVDDLDTSVVEHQWSIRKKAQMIFQNPENQIVGTTVEEDIAFGLSNIAYEQKNMDKQIEWSLEKVGLQNKKKNSVYALSGGEKQKLAIAAALALSPKYLILDEATSMLDEAARNSVLSTIVELKNKLGLGIIYITHHLEEIVQADRIFLFHEGKIVGEHTPASLLQEETLAQQCGLEIPFLPALSNRLQAGGITLPAWPTLEELVTALWK